MRGRPVATGLALVTLASGTVTLPKLKNLTLPGPALPGGTVAPPADFPRW